MENENITKEEKINSNAPETQTWAELVRFALTALIFVIIIRTFIIEPFVVSGSSMVPTFTDKDYLIIDKISYRLGDPQRDDVIVFKYPHNTSKYFIKRIIALPGETIDVRGETITITNDTHPDGLVLEQPFIRDFTNDDIHLKLKPDEYYVMGDNRPASSDSRVWGTLNKKYITGKVFLRLLPIKNVDIHPGQYIQAEN